MAITYVGKSSPAASSGSNLTVTATYSSTGGNTLIACIQHQGGALATPAVTDSAGNTWLKGVDTWDIGASGTRRIAIWYCRNATAVTSVTATGTAAFVRLFVYEINGDVSYRGGATATSGSASPPAAAVAGVKTGDFVVGCLGYFEDTPGSREDTLVTAGGYAELDSYDAGTTTYMASAFDIRASDGDSGPSWTMSPAQTTAGATVAFAATNVDYVKTIDDTVVIGDTDTPFTLGITETIAEAVGITDTAFGPLLGSKAESVGVSDSVSAILVRADASTTMPQLVVEIAFNSGYATADAARTWTDVSNYVELDEEIEIGFARGDEFTQANPNTLSLTLNNTDGRFTAARSSSPYYPNVKLGRPIRVRAFPPLGGTPVTRFVGYVDEWPLEWEATEDFAKARVRASSRTAWMNNTAELRSIVEETISLGSPYCYYTLAEPEGATRASDLSVYAQPALIPTGTGTGVTFGTGTGPGTDGLTAATFANGQYLRGEVAGLLNGTMTFECFFSTTTSSGLNQILMETDSASFVLGTNTAGRLVGMNAIVSAATVNDGAVHHAALTWDFIAGEVELFLDGVSQGSGSSTGPLGNALIVGKQFIGSISHAAVTFEQLSAEIISLHAASGQGGFTGAAPENIVTLYAQFAGIPTAELDLATGSVLISFIDTTGKTALGAMREVEQTEGGVLFDAQDGRLTFHGRSHRYDAASAFGSGSFGSGSFGIGVLALSAAAHEIEADFAPRLDRSAIRNDVTSTNASGVTARSVNTTSRDDYGLARESLELHTDDPEAPLQAASWLVNQYSEPRARVGTLTVNVLPLGLDLLDAILATTVGDGITVTDLPTQAAASTQDYIVEGYTERWGVESLVMTFNVSPAQVWEVWTVGDDTYGAMDEFPLAY